MIRNAQPLLDSAACARLESYHPGWIERVAELKARQKTARIEFYDFRRETERASLIDFPPVGEWAVVPVFEGVRWRTVSSVPGRTKCEFIAHGEASLSSHYHDDDEKITVHQGELLITIEGERTFIKRGDSMEIPAGKFHRVETLCGGAIFDVIWYGDHHNGKLTFFSV